MVIGIRKAPTETSRTAGTFAIILLTISGLSAAAYCTRDGNSGQLDTAKLAKQFCVSLPAGSLVEARTQADHELHVVVDSAQPPVNEAPRMSTSVKKGGVIRFVVRSSIAGAVGVHGLSEIVPINSGEVVEIWFRAIYTGRFPLHFHGLDGTHVEVGALEVL